MIPQASCISQSQNCPPIEDFAIARLIRFLKQLHIKKYFLWSFRYSTSKKIKYSNYSLMLWAFSVFAFRQGFETV